MDSQGIYVFALREFQSFLLHCVCERNREAVWQEVRGAGTWLCHGNMICEVQQFRAGLKSAQPDREPALTCTIESAFSGQYVNNDKQL